MRLDTYAQVGAGCAAEGMRVPGVPGPHQVRPCIRRPGRHRHEARFRLRACCVPSGASAGPADAVRAASRAVHTRPTAVLPHLIPRFAGFERRAAGGASTEGCGDGSCLTGPHRCAAEEEVGP